MEKVFSWRLGQSTKRVLKCSINKYPLTAKTLRRRKKNMRMIHLSGESGEAQEGKTSKSEERGQEAYYVTSV